MRFVPLVLGAMIGLFAAVGCGGDKSPAAGGGTGGTGDTGGGGGAAAPAEIRIGVAGPISGGQAKNGEDLLDGTTMAVEEFNAKGGVLGRKIVIKVRDDMALPANAPSAAQQLVAEKVVGVIGHFNSGSTIPASEIYHKNGIITITPSSTNEFVTDRNYEDVFRVCGRDDQQAPAAGRFIADVFKAKRVAIFDDQTAYGKGLADGVERSLKGKCEVVLREHFDAKERNFRPYLAKLKEQNVDIWYFGGIYEQAAPMLIQARQVGITAPLMSGDGVHGYVDGFLKACGAAAEGTFTTFPATNPAFTERYKVRFGGKEPGPYAIFSHTATQILLEGIQKAGTDDPKAIAKAMHANTFDTSIGKVEFDAKGDVKESGEGNYIVWVVKDGRHTTYQRAK